MHEVFISYSNKDQNLADAVVSILEASRIKCWIAYRDACVGEDYAASIIRAIKDCKACVLILSEKSNESKHVLSEINSCVNYGVTIIPLRIADVMFGDALEYYLGKTHWLDALTDPIEEHINRLGERINILLKKNVETNIPAAKGTSPIHVFNHPKVDVMSTRMVKYQDLLSFGYNADKIAMQLMENDYVTCNGIGDDNQGNAGQWAQFVQNSTETFQYLINGEDKIVGDWSILALSPEMFAQAKAGELLEKDISLDVSEMIIFPGTESRKHKVLFRSSFLENTYEPGKPGGKRGKTADGSQGAGRHSQHVQPPGQCGLGKTGEGSAGGFRRAGQVSVRFYASTLNCDSQDLI